MRETLTILGDSLKLLRARKLFWIVVGISLVVGLLYASIGFNEEGATFLWFQVARNELLVEGTELSKMFYILLFTNFIIPHWLGFLAVLLSILTSCSVFPELMKEGSIETVLSKPVSRWKIFFVKYLGMLGFMAAPLTLFCLIVFLALGLRAEVWKWEVFLTVPLLTFVYSILYSFAVFVGVWTRSTLFALLATMMLWGVCFLVHLTELGFYSRIRNANAGLVQEGLELVDTGEKQEVPEDHLRYYNLIRKSTWVLPKPRKTTLLTKRFLIFDDELGEFAGVSLIGIGAQVPEEGIMREAQIEAEKRMSVVEILLPSALFQVVMLGMGGWIFARRDF
ncbi:ABC transporter permease subunit [Roseibacillus persicicus]|uniref:ABC transporter permease n=1 Tax=Roseibacillus persicicus TaxID=454148 RepID=UPI00398B743B